MRARRRAKARIVRLLLDEKDWRPRLELLARVYPGEYGRREIVPPAEPERKPMVKRMSMTLREDVKSRQIFQSRYLTPPAEQNQQAALAISGLSTFPDCWHW